ncbi:MULTISPECIES: hypothetical protein [Kamptonema]|uniref:hypothetical protein n=1 Tax=Kamptonema TaxID=1501433 RepID=UPI0012D84F4C|nr:MULTISPECIES: hypothetical protein [Kamptonema]
MLALNPPSPNFGGLAEVGDRLSLLKKLTAFLSHERSRYPLQTKAKDLASSFQGLSFLY